MSIFTELLRIAGFRESKAETELARARGILAEAHASQDEARRVLADFLSFSEGRERDLYEDLCRRLVKLREIEEVQWHVLELRNGERRREEALEEARHAVERASEAFAAARELHRLAQRMKEKFVEVARSYDEERLLELQRIEDLEMEEVHRVSQDRAEREEWEEAQDPR